MATPRASASHSRQDSTAAQTPAPAIPQSSTLTTLALAPPDTFDFLPALYALLRSLQQPSGIDAPAGAQDSSSAALPEGSLQQLERVASGANGKVELHDLGSAASTIRLKIQRARQTIASMPDIGRTVEEQAEEIAELEHRVEKQKAMLRKLGVRYDAVGI